MCGAGRTHTYTHVLTGPARFRRSRLLLAMDGTRSCLQALVVLPSGSWGEVMSDGKEVVPASHGGKGFSIDIAGIPIPLKRTFGALDKLIAVPIEVLADAIEKKLKSNLDEHVDTVKKERKKKGKTDTVKNPPIKTTKQIADLGPSASEIGPGEADMSAVWRSILDEILDGRDEADDLLRIVKTASSSDIRLFLERY